MAGKVLGHGTAGPAIALGIEPSFGVGVRRHGAMSRDGQSRERRGETHRRLLAWRGQRAHRSWPRKETRHPYRKVVITTDAHAACLARIMARTAAS